MDNLDLDTSLLDPDEMAPEQEDELIEEKLITENIEAPIHLDYKLKTMEERNALVTRIIEQTPRAQLTPRYLEILGDYIMGALTKEQRKEHYYITDNRAITIGRRETSLEGLAEKFENGEDGMYSLFGEADKNVLFSPKYTISPKDIEEVPGLKELRAAMEEVEAEGKKATGKRKYLLKKQLIEMRKDQYILKNAHKPTMYIAPSPTTSAKIDLYERKYIDEEGNPQSTGLITFFNPKHISAILCNYNALKIHVFGRHQSDFYYLMEDFDTLLRRALDPYPLYRDLVRLKIKGASNLEIQAALEKAHGIKHSVQYISSLWRNKIPKLIAEYAQNEYLLYHYTNEEYGKWKRCSCCGEYKLAHNRFFSKNKTSKDGWYSICKECRNKKKY